MNIYLTFTLLSLFMAAAGAGAAAAVLQRDSCRGWQRIITITNLVMMLGVVVVDMVALAVVYY